MAQVELIPWVELGVASSRNVIRVKSSPPLPWFGFQCEIMHACGQESSSAAATSAEHCSNTVVGYFPLGNVILLTHLSTFCILHWTCLSGGSEQS